MKFVSHLLVIGSLCLFLAACDEVGTYAPVTEISTIQPVPTSGIHRVINGETVYEIAWRYGLDYRYLAARNQIQPPYAIYVGQTIYLRGKPVISLNKPERKPTSHSQASVSSSVERSPNDVKQDHLNQLQKSTYLAQKRVVNKQSVEPQYAVSTWIWPARGKVVNRFSQSDKGINIYGRLGEPILAAAPGKVVYAGSGLRGYGNLIILKHNSLYLSAYAHNKAIFVREGDWVRQGQKIAEMGSTGTNKVMLHFEIRRSGRPLNPVSLYRQSGYNNI